MASKLEFREKLSGAVALGNEHDNVLSVEDVEKYFEDDNLSEEQMTLVYDYLLSQKIAVNGYEQRGGRVLDGDTKEESTPYTDEEASYLKNYEEELGMLPTLSEEEQKELVKRACTGDAMAKSCLVEACLPKVVEIAKSLHHPNIFVGDMIQEGNVGLMLAIDHISSEETAYEEICEGIRQSIQMMVEELSDLRSRDQAMVEKVRFLDESITKLTEEYGRKVSIEELAVYMELSEDEVLDILKLAGEDLDEEEEEHTHE